MWKILIKFLNPHGEKFRSGEHTYIFICINARLSSQKYKYSLIFLLIFLLFYMYIKYINIFLFFYRIWNILIFLKNQIFLFSHKRVHVIVLLVARWLLLQLWHKGTLIYESKSYVTCMCMINKGLMRIHPQINTCIYEYFQDFFCPLVEIYKKFRVWNESYITHNLSLFTLAPPEFLPQ